MQTHKFSFEKLVAWQDAKELAKTIYQETKAFPQEEKYGLTQQIRRSAMSVCANIAEGSTRSTAKDHAYFTTIAYGSLIELLNHLIIANEIGYLDSILFKTVRHSIEILSVKLSNLKKSQLSRIKGISLIVLMLFSWSIYAPIQPLILNR
jgi:four helix bundle protein